MIVTLVVISAGADVTEKPAGFKGNPYTSRAFAVGSVLGTRAWIIGNNGALTGVYHRYPWQPGINVAEHMGPIPAQGCDFLGLNCLCGFYGYYDGSNDYLQDHMAWADWRIAGIIEGWGKCVVGARGFRCEKAEVRALVTPLGVDEETLWQIAGRHPGVPWFATQADAVDAFPLTVRTDVDAQP